MKNKKVRKAPPTRPTTNTRAVENEETGWEFLERLAEKEKKELPPRSDVSPSSPRRSASPSTKIKGATKIPSTDEASGTKSYLNVAPNFYLYDNKKRERSKSPRGNREEIPEKSKGLLSGPDLAKNAESKRRSREIKTMKSYPESSSPGVGKAQTSSSQPEGVDEIDMGPTRLRGKYAKVSVPSKNIDDFDKTQKLKAPGKTAATKQSKSPAVRKKTSTPVNPQSAGGEDEPDIGPTRLRGNSGKYAKSSLSDENLDQLDIGSSKPIPKTSKYGVKEKSTKKKTKIDTSNDFHLPTKESKTFSKDAGPVWMNSVGGLLKKASHIGSSMYGSLSEKSGNTLSKSRREDEVEENKGSIGLEEKVKHSTFLRQLSTENTIILYDDPDRDEGNTSYEDDDSFGGLSAPPEILARGPRARRAYTEAARAGTKKVFRTRLMLVGQERVGKTSLKKSLTGQGFDKDEAITDGVETTNACEISIEVAQAGGSMWFIPRKGSESEKTKEDEYSKALADQIAKRLIVTTPQDPGSAEPQLDATDGRGLNPEQAEEFFADNMETPKAAGEDDNMPNQIASLVEKMLKEQVRMKSCSHRKESGEDSADGREDDGVSLSIWDFAGHDIYYTTHQVFLTWRAIYVIVFDLSRSLDSVVPPECRDEDYEVAKGGAKSELTWLEFINFWLCSIYAHAVAPSSIKKTTSKTAQKSPPIFIVGTHRESVKGNAKEKKKKIDSAFEKIRKSIKKKPFECHVVPKYYAIENSLDDNDEELTALRKHIGKVAIEEPYMGEEIPLRWLLFEEAIATDKINYMSLDQVKELTRPVGMESERELLTMLAFYHDLGYIVYYGDMVEHQSLLRDIVILNPQWLIDVFKQVITILDPAERDGIVSDAWSILEEDGILEDRLIQHMWQGFLEQKEALVELMARFDLICEAPSQRLQQETIDSEVSEESEEMKKCYYVPSRLTSHCTAEEMGQIKSSLDFYVDFRGFLPDGLFHRLMTRAVRWMTERDGEPVILFYRQISLMADDDHHALLEMLPHHEAAIKVSVFRPDVASLDDEDDNNHQPPAPSAVKEVMEFVTRTLDNLRNHWAKRIQYDVCFACPKCGKKKPFQECFKRKSLQCGLHRITTASVKSKFGMLEEGVESGSDSPLMCRRSTHRESSILCDRYFSDLAEEIGSEWQRLGIRLGLKQADIDHITEDKLTAVDRILAMLQLWRQRSSDVDKRKMIEELCKALRNCSRTDLAESIIEAAGIK